MNAPAGSLGGEALAWLLRRLRQGVALEHDLVMVYEHPALADLSDSLEALGVRWRCAKVTGELTMREALLDAERLIAILPVGFAPPLDLAGRALLGRPLELRTRDVVSALAGRFCEPVEDEVLERSILERLGLLRESTLSWGAGDRLTAREVRSVLASVVLGGGESLGQERDHALLARWVVEGPPEHIDALAARVLVETHPRTGPWLAWAVGEGSLEGLVSAGALAGTGAGWAAAEPLPGLESSPQRRALQRLVELAVRAVYERDAVRASAILEDAELRYASSGVSPEKAARHPLLRGALERALEAFAAAAAGGEPPEDTAIQTLASNLHAPRLGAEIERVRDLARLARFLAAAPRPVEEAPAEDWLLLAREHVTWSDWLLRRARRRLEEAPAAIQNSARTLIQKTLNRRDVLNRSFGLALGRDWARLSANKDIRTPLPLHQVSRCLLRRLLDDGHRVLLLVLDGCDLSTFFELLQAMDQRGIGLGRPVISDPVLRSDLIPGGPLLIGVAPLPTVTNHARRALFAGEIPGDTALDSAERTSADASADEVAWKRNQALGAYSRRLFLKGALVPDSAALIGALRSGDAPMLAAVYNGVDDALSSKEVTPLGPWTPADLGAGALQALEVALDEGWTVLLTSDHGHTPYVGQDRKVAHRAAGQRYSLAPTEGAILFEHGPLPARPLHLLTAVGAWYGNQRRGYHGGASLEEVAVPLAFLGRVTPGEGGVQAPWWWWSAEPPGVEEPEPTREEAPAPAPAAPSPGEAPQDGWLASLPEGGVRRIFAHIESFGTIGEAEAATMLGGPRHFRRFARRFEDYKKHAPFKVHATYVGGTKRYVRER